MYNHIDTSTGELITFYEPLRTGLMTDLDGVDHFFKLVAGNYIDVQNGVIIKRFNELLNEAKIVGRDITVSNTRAGARKSIFNGGAVAQNVADMYTVNGIPLFSSMAGATNLVSTIVEADGWASDSNLTRSTPSTGVYRIAYDGGGTNRNIYFSIGDASANRYARCQIRLVSGTPTTDHKFTFWQAAPVGTGVTLETLTTEWQDFSCSVTSATASTYLLLNFSTTAVTIEVRYMRCTATTYPVAPFPDGSSATTAYANDALECTPAWTGEGTIVSISNRYSNGARGGAFDNYNRVYDVPGDKQNLAEFVGEKLTLRLGGVATIDESTTLTGIQVTSSDWDGSTCGGRFDTDARVTISNSTVPSGILYIGNDISRNVPWGGWMTVFIFNRVLSDAEYTAFYMGLTAINYPTLV
jgi:hypothetical protein